MCDWANRIRESPLVDQRKILVALQKNAVEKYELNGKKIQFQPLHVLVFFKDRFSQLYSCPYSENNISGMNNQSIIEAIKNEII